MKKLVSCLCGLLLAGCLFAGCTAAQKEEPTAAAEPAPVSTDVPAPAAVDETATDESAPEDRQTWSEKAPDGDYYIEVYEKDGHVYRVDDDTMLY